MIGLIVGTVRDCACYRKRDAVLITNLPNCGPFHLNGKGGWPLRLQGLLCRRAVDELIATQNRTRVHLCGTAGDAVLRGLRQLCLPIGVSGNFRNAQQRYFVFREDW